MEENKPVTSMRVAELVMAALFLAFGAIVMWDSRRLGSSWADDGPQAGYFPFYIGLAIVISAVAIIFRALNLGEKGKAAFVEWGQLRMILVVMIPTVVYVALIANPWFGLGIYLASALFIAFFMWHLGKYGWAKIAPVSIGVVVFFFMMFEIWFKVPLPKGPIEAALGFS
ncbi:MAG TPA: tripartite tricarboxylate transporter TctB family protein [Usitatibacteraceae bacterium]|nr:tripartite tricarboxylate transporter TctB family protein [Usitatibacteraceae bacterium]